LFKDLNDISFWGTDIISEVKTVSMKAMESVIQGMTEGEARAYRLGVDNTLMLIPQLMTCAEADDIIFYDKNCPIMQEFTLDDLEKRLNHE